MPRFSPPSKPCDDRGTTKASGATPWGRQNSPPLLQALQCQLNRATEFSPSTQSNATPLIRAKKVRAILKLIELDRFSLWCVVSWEPSVQARDLELVRPFLKSGGSICHPVPYLPTYLLDMYLLEPKTALRLPTSAWLTPPDQQICVGPRHRSRGVNSSFSRDRLRGNPPST